VLLAVWQVLGPCSILQLETILQSVLLRLADGEGCLPTWWQTPEAVVSLVALSHEPVGPLQPLTALAALSLCTAVARFLIGFG
jgi:hypothetical protein